MREGESPEARSHLDEIMRGYQSSIVLLVASKVGVFKALGERQRAAPDIAAELSLDTRALRTVLLALAADGFLEVEGDDFRITAAYAPLLRPDSPETMADILNHNHTCMLRWAELQKVLRTGEPVPRATRQRPEDEERDFICGMANISRLSSVEVATAFDFTPYRNLLDLGGGPGTSSIVFAQRYPQLRCVVFDLPGPIAIAEEQIAAAGLADRITTRCGDFFADELGSGYDLVYVANIIHSLGPEDVFRLISKVHQALVPAGTLVVKDMFLDETRIHPRSSALFSVNMLTATAQGRSYTLAEAQQILIRVGFGDFGTKEVARFSALLVARKM